MSDSLVLVEKDPAGYAVVTLNRPQAMNALSRALRAGHAFSAGLQMAGEELAEPIAGEMARLHRLARTLREQCPWDREQTHASLTRHLLEETYEVLEAIDHLDAAGLLSELQAELTR